LYSGVPTYPLTDVQHAVAQNAGRFPPGYKINPDNTLEPAGLRLGCGWPEALKYIEAKLGELGPGNFVKSDPEPPPPADVYGYQEFRGVPIERYAWYIKFKFHGRRFSLISFHPPQWRLKLTSGDELDP